MPLGYIYRCNDVESNIYMASDDSYLLIDTIKKEIGSIIGIRTLLDLGSGSGVIARALYSMLDDGFYKEDIIAIDISPCSVEYIKRTRIREDLWGIEILQCNGPTCLRDNSIDLVAINPPYLPLNERNSWLDISWSGGYKGVSVALEFLKELRRVTRRRGLIYIVLSTLGDLEYFKEKASRLGYLLEVIARKKLFFEELLVYRIYSSDHM